MPLVWSDPSSDFTPGGELGGCPDLSGTYEVEGRGTDYLITFPLPLIVPVWWGRDPEPPRLDADLDLVRDASFEGALERIARVELRQPNAIRLVATLLDESGHPIEELEEIEFSRGGRSADRPDESPRSFHCLTSSGPLAITKSVGLVISSGKRYQQSGTYGMTVTLGRMPDGSLAVQSHAYRPSLLMAADQRWHRYEPASTRLPSD